MQLNRFIIYDCDITHLKIYQKYQINILPRLSSDTRSSINKIIPFLNRESFQIVNLYK